METFAKPAIAAIIEKIENGKTYIIIQTRNKEDGGIENGMTEIPAGKIRNFENLFDAIRREVWEETGLQVTTIRGEDEIVLDETNGYQTSSCQPFCVTQNLKGGYSLVVLAFICEATGELLIETNETKDIRWEEVTKVEEMLRENPNQFFPMNINILRKYFHSYHKKQRV